MDKRMLIVLGLFFLAGCTTVEQKSKSAVERSAEIPTHQQMVIEPLWQVGDYWQWSDGYGLEVSHVEGETTRFDRSDAEGQWISRKGFFKEEAKSSTTYRKVVYRSKHPRAIFPLVKGNRVSFMREYMANNQLRVHRTSWTVEGQETINVPAGAFECWVLLMETRSANGDWKGYERWWYSPEVKNYVRMEYRYGLTPESSRVLTKFGKR
ncbi:MAG: hypothetical protein HN842_06420 [Gammaproteobacteria bacterium]|nr:hypothetical protein [Gammaproteobacteria bacterium]